MDMGKDMGRGSSYSFLLGHFGSGTNDSLMMLSHGLVTQSVVLDSVVCDKDQKTGHSAGLLIDESLKV